MTLWPFGLGTTVKTPFLNCDFISRSLAASQRWASGPDSASRKLPGSSGGSKEGKCVGVGVVDGRGDSERNADSKFGIGNVLLGYISLICSIDGRVLLAEGKVGLSVVV